MEARTAQARTPPLRAKRAHRMLAAFLLIFVAIHFATHFAALGGPQSHEQALSVARPIYRFPLVEIALVLALAAQVMLGIQLLRSIARRVRKGLWHKVQFVSGVYLAYFIVMHTGAAIFTRIGMGLDTNFYWAAGTLVLTPIKYGFAPYYALAVTAIVSHLIAAMHFRHARAWHAPALALGPLLGVLFVLGYGGAFSDFDLPSAYRGYFSAFPGVAA